MLLYVKEKERTNVAEAAKNTKLIFFKKKIAVFRPPSPFKLYRGSPIIGAIGFPENIAQAGKSKKSIVLYTRFLLSPPV